MLRIALVLQLVILNACVDPHSIWSTDAGVFVTDAQTQVVPDSQPTTQPPGSACNCDSDCSDTGGYTPLCIHGVCGVVATDEECEPGTRDACPSAHRCWNGRCYPDYDSSTCAGREDEEGSCVSSDDLECYRSCGTYCRLEGEPEGT